MTRVDTPTMSTIETPFDTTVDGSFPFEGVAFSVAGVEAIAECGCIAFADGTGEPCEGHDPS